MKREFSAGGIVFNNGQVLLISNAAMRDPSKKYWGFPKGHLEEGESSREAAVREVREEVGIEVEIVEKIGDSKYVFTINGERIFKSVSCFLMRHLKGEVKIQEEEILEAIWFPPEKALETLSFKQDRDFLKIALEKMNGQ